jgi:hypothetical protein
MGMNELSPEYVSALVALGRVCKEYRTRTGGPAYLVGGAAVAIFTQGTFHSADFDLVVAFEDAFHKILLDHGFIPEDRGGKLLVGYYHPDHPQFGWQLVTGPLFDGRSDKGLAVQLELEAGSAVVLPAVEDLIADRLAQYESNRLDPSRLHQAELLFQVAEKINMDYLKKRVAEEGGDTTLLDTWHRD